jgi:hypothetical protein
VESKIWGTDEILWTSPTVEVHLLRVAPVDGKPVRCSIHRHLVKANAFRVLSGRFEVCELKSEGRGQATRVVLSEGEETRVYPPVVHWFVVREPATVLEFVWLSGPERDIERLSEGRVIDDEPTPEYCRPAACGIAPLFPTEDSGGDGVGVHQTPSPWLASRQGG